MYTNFDIHLLRLYYTLLDSAGIKQTFERILFSYTFEMASTEREGPGSPAIQWSDARVTLELLLLAKSTIPCFERHVSVQFQL